MDTGAPTDGTCGPAAIGTECRAAADACDLVEACNGVSPLCPPDARMSACMPDAGAADASIDAASSEDAGAMDAGLSDAGLLDAAVPVDAASSSDGGPATDASGPATDGGGPVSDGGTTADASTGTPPDSGSDGCSCRAPGSAAPLPWNIAGLLGLVVALRIRRRMRPLRAQIKTVPPSGGTMM